MLRLPGQTPTMIDYGVMLMLSSVVALTAANGFMIKTASPEQPKPNPSTIDAGGSPWKQVDAAWQRKPFDDLKSKPEINANGAPWTDVDEAWQRK